MPLGLLAVAYQLAFDLTLPFPITADNSLRYAPAGLLPAGVVVVIALALLAFRGARGGGSVSPAG